MNTDTHFQHHAHSEQLRPHDMIAQVLRCHQECMETMQYCIQHGGEHADPHHLKTMQTCIEVTYATARLMMLQSPYQRTLNALCAEVCLACAKECAAMQDDAMMVCAKICQETADAL